MRLLVKTFEPRIPGRKRAILKDIIDNEPAKKAQDMEGNVPRVELVWKYEALP